MTRTCYVCKEVIDGDDFVFYELFGHCHKDCVTAKASVITKELGVKKYQDSVNASEMSQEERDRVIEENTIDDVDD